MTSRASAGTRWSTSAPLPRDLRSIAVASLLLAGAVAPAAAGGERCDPAVPGFEPCHLPPPAVYVFGYDYSAAPRWTSNGWSSPPTRPVPVPPPGPFYYAPPVYAYPHAPCSAGCGGEGFLLFPWDRWR
jgi:hypothetical protein